MPTEVETDTVDRMDPRHPSKRLLEAAKQVRLASESGEIGHSDELAQIWARLRDLADEVEDR